MREADGTQDAEVVALLAELVAIDSVNPGLVPGAAGEARIVDHLGARLRRSGFTTTVVGPPERPSLIAVPAEVQDGGPEDDCPEDGGAGTGRGTATSGGIGGGAASGGTDGGAGTGGTATGTGTRPTVVLNGHLDTVGVAGMPEPFTPRVDGDRMTGRGTVDMKGGVAALVVAAERLVASGSLVRPVLALVADEEDASLGSEAVIAALPGLGIRPDACLIAEPTDGAICRSPRGFGVVRVTFAGRAAHSSQPGLGVNAVTHLGRLLHAVDDRSAAVRAAGGDLMVTVARGGRSAFVVPDHAECLVELRTPPGRPGTDALKLVRSLLDPSWRAHAELVGHRDGWRLESAGPAADLASRLGDALGTGPTFDAPYWMEAPLWQAVCPTLICGPAGGGLHSADEWVDLAGVRALTAAVVTALTDWTPHAGRADASGRADRDRGADRDDRESHGDRKTRATVPTDPRNLRAEAPLLDAWLSFQEHPRTPFTIPGHKQRTDLVGDVVAGDVPLYAGLDTMKLSAGVLADAEARAARLWGADVCRFSVGGATHANQAVALALGGDGDRVVVSRTLHRSLLLGLVLAGLTPVWVRPDVDPATGLPLGVAPATVERALAENPGVRAVLVGDPSYVGTVGDVAGLAAVAHEHGVPLVVDAAWAAHFGFHPSLPQHALQLGADVVVTSAHKTLPAWSQAALILARTDRIDPARLDAGVEATATTSPAGAVLASIDAARALLERDGTSLLDDAIAATRAARERLRTIDGLGVLAGPAVDPLKLTLLLPGTGADGNAVEQDLLAAGVPLESADRDVLVGVVTLADTPHSLDVLVTALTKSVERHRGTPRAVLGGSSYTIEPVAAIPPRAAFFASASTVPAEHAVGRVSAELIAPYPPGIPVLAPGEEVTDGVLEALGRARAAGVRIAYAADPSLATLRVVDGPERR